MYFSNISNKELTQFHNQNIKNFSISLTDLLSSGLFKVETIISNSLYRVYPLFYCKNITSTNDDDVILDTKCLILNKASNETFLSFISDENAPVMDYKNHTGYFDIRDDLTEAEFNAIVQLLRNNHFNESIRIGQGTINGTYGDYVFNINSTTLIDTGILITMETISNFGTVKLVNPVFPNSTYTLNLKVYHITDVNVIPDSSDDHIEVETISIELIPNTPVNIPFTDYDYDENYVIGFDATVDVVHDKSFIKYVNTLIVDSVPQVIQSGDTCEIYATAYDYNNLPVDGETVYFFEKFTESISVSASKNILQSGDTAEIYATVKDDDGSLVKGVAAYFYKVLQDVLLYSNDGTDTSSITAESGVSVTVSGGALKITTSTSGEKHAYYPTELDSSMNFMFECEIYTLSFVQSVAVYMNNSTTATGCWLAYNDDTATWSGGIKGSSFNNVTTSGDLYVGDKVRIRQEDGVITFYHNDDVIFSKEASFSGTYYVGHYTNQYRSQYIDNVKIVTWEE